MSNSKDILTSKLAEFCATFFYVGKIKYCPGTFGSIATIPFALLILLFADLIDKSSIFSKNYMMPFILSSALLLLLTFLIALWSIKIYLKKSNSEDPGEVVIDETVGQLIALIIPFFYMIFMDPNYNYLNLFILSIISFLFFRLFDISKIGPVGYFDRNVKGEWGIIMDDVVAGVFAGFLSIPVLYFLYL